MKYDPNKEPGKYIGINKRLFLKRLELDYSITEACIKLDISSTKLHLIERGYIKVKPALQKKFIRKYGLDQNFFNDDEYLYPTKIENDEPSEEEVHKFNKFISSPKYKIITFAIALIGIAMVSVGLANQPKTLKETSSFFSSEINEINKIVKEKGEEKDFILDSFITTPSILKDNYYTLAGETFKGSEESNLLEFSTNVAFPTLEENLSYGFTYGSGYAQPSILEMAVFGENPLQLNIETRVYKSDIRCRIEAIDEFNFNYFATFQYRQKTSEYQFDIVEISYSGIREQIKDNELTYFVITNFFETAYENYRVIQESNNFSKNFKTSFQNYEADMIKGSLAIGDFDKVSELHVVLGLVLGVFSIALCILSFIVSFHLDKKLSSRFVKEGTGEDLNILSTAQKDLPKNRWPTPCIPERVLRILAILICLSASLSTYFLFRNIVNMNIGGVINDLTSVEVASSLTSISILLVFFMKLDIKQNEKKSFTTNYFLFFLGLIFYFLLMIIEYSLSFSKSINADLLEVLMNMLPGNIIWGVLSFNLLISTLFSKPNFKTHQKRNMILFRCLSIIPISYMVISSLCQIGKKLWGWNLPLSVSTLLFSKALILILFAIIYCFAVFAYRKYITYKYGEEKGEIYQTGNRYCFVKNVIASVIIIVLGILDIIIGKNWPGNPVMNGSFYPILFCVPVVLLYHPHFGKRNAKWDISFVALYAVSMLLGILLIAAEVGNVIVYL